MFCGSSSIRIDFSITLGSLATLCFVCEKFICWDAWNYGVQLAVHIQGLPSRAMCVSGLEVGSSRYGRTVRFCRKLVCTLALLFLGLLNEKSGLSTCFLFCELTVLSFSLSPLSSISLCRVLLLCLLCCLTLLASSQTFWGLVPIQLLLSKANSHFLWSLHHY